MGARMGSMKNIARVYARHSVNCSRSERGGGGADWQSSELRGWLDDHGKYSVGFFTLFLAWVLAMLVNATTVRLVQEVVRTGELMQPFSRLPLVAPTLDFMGNEAFWVPPPPPPHDAQVFIE